MMWCTVLKGSEISGKEVSLTSQPDQISSLQFLLKTSNFLGLAYLNKSDGGLFQIKYSVSVDGVEVESDGVIVTNCEKPHYDVKLKSAHLVSSDSKIKLSCSILDPNRSAGREVDTGYGHSGNDYTSVKNEHMGLFKFEDANDNGSYTCVRHGHFGEIMYSLP